MIKKITLVFLLLCNGVLYAQFEFEYGEQAKPIVLKQHRAKRYHEVSITIKGKSFHFTSFPTLDEYDHFSSNLKCTFTNDSVLILKGTQRDNYYFPHRQKGVYTFILRNGEYYEYDPDNNIPIAEEIGLRKTTKDSAGYEVSRSVFYRYDAEISKKDSNITYVRNKYDEEHRLIESYELHSPPIQYPLTKYNYRVMRGSREIWEYSSGLVKSKKYLEDKTNEMLIEINYTHTAWNKDSTENTNMYVHIHHRTDSTKWDIDTLTEHINYSYDKDGNMTNMHKVSFDSWFKVTQEDMEMEVEYKKD
ncbi:MAG TPA: hypothetical protein VK890_01435 [Bacteroidia bacterium]|jgi:hypothetical protein|nr:hypothetical protein [Bacteroidia bacterium]